MQDKIGTTHVWAKLEVAHTTLDILVGSVIEVTVQDLLGKRQGTPQPIAKM